MLSSCAGLVRMSCQHHDFKLLNERFKKSSGERTPSAHKVLMDKKMVSAHSLKAIEKSVTYFFTDQERR